MGSGTPGIRIVFKLCSTNYVCIIDCVLFFPCALKTLNGEHSALMTTTTTPNNRGTKPLHVAFDLVVLFGAAYGKRIFLLMIIAKLCILCQGSRWNTHFQDPVHAFFWPLMFVNTATRMRCANIHTKYSNGSCQTNRNLCVYLLHEQHRSRCEFPQSIFSTMNRWLRMKRMHIAYIQSTPTKCSKIKSIRTEERKKQLNSTYSRHYVWHSTDIFWWKWITMDIFLCLSKKKNTKLA